MKILIDNGHGLNTPGKRSPDGTFLEASYNREIAKRIVIDLLDRGYDAQLLVPEDHDIPLSERVKRVNEICLTNEPSRTPHRHTRPYNRHGRPRPAISSSSPAPTGDLMPNVILISIHVNAAGNGSKWLNATGWSVYTCKGQTESDRLADCLCEAAIKHFPGRRIRTDFSDSDPDWEENFSLLSNTLCPAVLTENFFMDSRSDLEYLQSRVSKQAVVDTHVEGIIEYIESLIEDSHEIL